MIQLVSREGTKQIYISSHFFFSVINEQQRQSKHSALLTDVFAVYRHLQTWFANGANVRSCHFTGVT